MNKRITIKSGFTIIEMLVVISIIILMLAIVTPSIPGMISSQNMSSSQNIITTALSQAQAYAASHHKKAGLRIQQTKEGRQHIVLIEKTGGNIYEYNAIPNAKTITFPKGICLISMDVDSDKLANDKERNGYLMDFSNSGNGFFCLENAQTFSLIFSPNGQLITPYVEVRKRDDTIILD